MIFEMAKSKINRVLAEHAAAAHAGGAARIFWRGVFGRIDAIHRLTRNFAPSQRRSSAAAVGPGRLCAFHVGAMRLN